MKKFKATKEPVAYTQVVKNLEAVLVETPIGADECMECCFGGGSIGSCPPCGLGQHYVLRQLED